jgi:general secretion pathway protein N
MMPVRMALAVALTSAALVGRCVAAAAPDLAVDPGLRPEPRPPSLDLEAPSAPAKTAPVLRAGNPLWAVPLSSLTATRERPLFSASRRPPPAPVAAVPVVQAVRAPPPPRPREPERPRLLLVGTVGGEDGIAVFVDQATQAVVRLRTGEGHDGWVLRTVVGREVTLQNDRDTAILTLPRPDGR